MSKISVFLTFSQRLDAIGVSFDNGALFGKNLNLGLIRRLKRDLISLHVF